MGVGYLYDHSGLLVRADGDVEHTRHRQRSRAIGVALHDEARTREDLLKVSRLLLDERAARGAMGVSWES